MAEEQEEEHAHYQQDQTDDHADHKPRGGPGGGGVACDVDARQAHIVGGGTVGGCVGGVVHDQGQGHLVRGVQKGGEGGDIEGGGLPGAGLHLKDAGLVEDLPQPLGYGACGGTGEAEGDGGLCGGARRGFLSRVVYRPV